MTAEIEHPPAVRRLRHRPGATLRVPVAVPVEPTQRDEPGVAIEANAADLRVLFEEAAGALVRLTSLPEAAGPACRWETVTLRARDLPGLAGLWLDRLIEIGEQQFSDERRMAIVIVAVDRVASPEEDPQNGRWMLRARVGLRPYYQTGPRATPEIRSASDRPLTVDRDAGSWTLRGQLAF